MLLATALALLITGCAQQTFTVQRNALVATKGNHHPSFLRFWNWAEEKLSMQPKFVAAQKMLLKQKPVQTFVNGLFIYYISGIYTSAGSACVLPHNNCMSCPSIWATLSALLINILRVPSSCFCIVISLSLRVK